MFEVGGGAHEHTRGHESLSMSHPGAQATRGLTSSMGNPPAFFSFFLPSTIQKIVIEHLLLPGSVPGKGKPVSREDWAFSSFLRGDR